MSIAAFFHLTKGIKNRGLMAPAIEEECNGISLVPEFSTLLLYYGLPGKTGQKPDRNRTL